MSTRVRVRSLGHIKKRSVAEEAQDRLISAIASRQLEGGERIIESDIAEDLGVSRIPVREAILHLGSLGILEPAGNRGWQVSSFDERRIDEIYQVRLALETTMLAAAQNRIKSDGPALLVPLDNIIDNMQQAAKDEDSEHLNQLDLEFHRYAVSLSENRLGMKIWEGISQHVLIIFEMEIYRIPHAQSVVAQHVRLKQILAEGNKAALAEVLVDHITGYRSVMLDQERARSAGADAALEVTGKPARKV